MSQNVENIQPSYPLFRSEEYKANLSNKQNTVEERAPMEKIQEVFQWTTTQEYQDLNFQREALTVNPAKACQPGDARRDLAGSPQLAREECRLQSRRCSTLGPLVSRSCRPR